MSATVQPPTTTGPLGVPMTDDQARALDLLLADHTGEPEVKRMRTPTPAVTAIDPEEDQRSETSWISTELPDRHRDIVLAKGMRAGLYRMNPIVTLNHAFADHPIGINRSLELKKHPLGGQGILAETHYPPRPEQHDGDWQPDEVLALIRAGLLNGKSISFLPLKVRPANDTERTQGVHRVIEQWELLEYCVCAIPVNPATVVVSKAMRELLDGTWPAEPDDHTPVPPPMSTPSPPPLYPHVRLGTLRDELQRRLQAIDAQKIVRELLNRRVGRV